MSRRAASATCAGGNQRPHAGTGNHLAVDLHRLDHFQGNARLPAELPEDLDVAAAVVAEEEVLPLDHPAGTKLAQDDAIEEFAGGEPQQCRIGRIGHDGIDSQFVQQPRLVLGPTQRRGGLLRDARAGPDADRR